ncbi:hypothetical protein COBT_003904, partial [Conglomerata obtusa]
EKMSKNVELLTLKGYIETRLDNEVLAKQTFKNVIKLDPHAYEPWMYLGEIYINEEEFEKAYTSFKLSYKKTIATPYLSKRLLSLTMYFKRFDEIKLYCKEINGYKNFYDKYNIDQIIVRKQNDLYITKYIEMQNKCIREPYEETKTIENSNVNTNMIHKINDENKKISFSQCSRTELIQYVYELTFENKYNDVFILLQEAFVKENIESTVQNIIFIEWIEFLYILLKSLEKFRYCYLKLRIANVIFSIFDKINKSFYACFYYLILHKKYDAIFDLLTLNVFDDMVYVETKEIIKDIVSKHPEYQIDLLECE